VTLALIESPGPPSLRGAWLALALHACWSLTLCGLLLGPAPGRLPAVAVALLVLLRTFLQTGLGKKHR
jgi:hypothetical protein